MDISVQIQLHHVLSTALFVTRLVTVPHFHFPSLCDPCCHTFHLIRGLLFLSSSFCFSRSIRFLPTDRFTLYVGLGFPRDESGKSNLAKVASSVYRRVVQFRISNWHPYGQKVRSVVYVCVRVCVCVYLCYGATKARFVVANVTRICFSSFYEKRNVNRRDYHRKTSSLISEIYLSRYFEYHLSKMMRRGENL